MSGFDILLQAANRQSHDADNNIVDSTNKQVVASTANSQAGSLYTNYISSSSSSNNLPPKKRIKVTNNHSTTCSIDGLSTIISNATNNNTTANITDNSNSMTSTLKKTKSWNNSTYIQFRNTNNLNNNWDNDSMSVSTIGMRSVSSLGKGGGEKRGGKGGEGSGGFSSSLLLPRTSSSLYSSKKNEVWNIFSPNNNDSPTLISSDKSIINNNMLRREGSRSEGSSLHQLYNLNLVIPNSKKQKKQRTRKFYKRGGFDNIGKVGSSSCTDVNGIEMGMGYFSSRLSTTSSFSTTLSPADPHRIGGKKKKRPRTEELVVVPQDELSTSKEEEEVLQDANSAATSEEVPQVRRSRPQEEEGSAIVVNVTTTPTSKLNNNGLMNENAKYLIAKSQLYQAYLQALNNHQD